MISQIYNSIDKATLQTNFLAHSEDYISYVTLGLSTAGSPAIPPEQLDEIRVRYGKLFNVMYNQHEKYKVLTDMYIADNARYLAYIKPKLEEIMMEIAFNDPVEEII